MRRPIKLPTFTREQLFRLPAEWWNDMIRDLIRTEIIEVTETASVREAHAWKTRIRWNAEAGQWRAIVGAGIVNWEEAVVAVTDAKGVVSDVPLSQGPELPLARFRPVVDVPPYFASRYQFKPAEEFRGDFDFGGGFVRNPVAEAAARADGGWRTLWSCSIHLTVRRPQTVVDVRPDGRVLLGLSNAHEEVFRVGTSTTVPDVAVPSPLAQLRDGLRDPGVDVQPLATVYMLSPAGGDPKKEPDRAFQPFVEHHAFYHLRHAVRVPDVPLEGIEVSLGYTGFGGEIIRQLLDDLERQDSVINATISRSQVLGKFWSV
jgi:hypothetical protein